MSKRPRAGELDSASFSDDARKAKFPRFEDVKESLYRFLPYGETQSFREWASAALPRDCAIQTHQGGECVEKRHTTAIGPTKNEDSRTDNISSRCTEYCVEPPVCAVWMTDLLTTIANFAGMRLHLDDGGSMVVPIPEGTQVSLLASDYRQPALVATRNAAKEVWQIWSPSGDLFEDKWASTSESKPQGLPSSRVVGVPQARDFYAATLPVGNRLIKALVRSREVEADVVDLTEGLVYVNSSDAAHIFCQLIRAIRRSDFERQQLICRIKVPADIRRQQRVTNLEFLDRDGRAVAPHARWILRQRQRTFVYEKDRVTAELVLSI